MSDIKTGSNSIYLCVFKSIFYPHTIHEIKFSCKNDKEAIKMYTGMYITENVKELKKQVNETNILVIHTNPLYFEPKKINYSDSTGVEHGNECKPDKRKIKSKK